MIFVKPLNGLSVPDPDHGDMLPIGGRLVNDNQYWQRRIADGSVELDPAGVAASPPVITREVVIYQSLNDVPSAGSFGSGIAQAGNVLMVSNGAKWSPANSDVKKNKIAILGDSYDERSMPTTTSPIGYNAYAIWRLTNMLMMGAMDIIYVDGMSGTGAIAGSTLYKDRIDAVISQNPNWISIRCSVNDIIAGATFETLVTEYSKLFSKVNNSGIRLITNTINCGSYFLTTTQRRSVWARFNAWLMNIAPSLFDVVVLPLHWQCLDRTVTTGANDTSLMADNLHPETPGAFLMAKTAAEILLPFFPNKHHLFSACAVGVADETAADPNPINAGSQSATGTGISGTVATSYGLSTNSGLGTIVGSKVARTDGPGEWQQIVWTPTAANQLAIYQPSSIALSAGLAIGDIISAAFEFEIDAATADADCPIPTLRVVFNGAGIELQSFVYNSGALSPKKSGWRGLLSSEKIAIPAGTTSIFFMCRFQNKTTGAITARIGQHAIFNHSKTLN